MKNYKVDKKKVGSIALALGMMITPSLANADITSYLIPTTLKDGRSIFLYYTNENNKSLICLDNQVGFVDNEYITDISFDSNNYFTEVNKEEYIKVDSANLYSDSYGNNVINTIPYGSKVYLYAKTIDGYYVVYCNNQMGFIKEECLIEQKRDEIVIEDTIETIEVAKITGNNINVRSTPTTKKKNVIGFCDMTDKFVILGKENDFYEIDYLGKVGYVSSKYVREETINKKDLEVKKMLYIKNSCPFYRNLNGDMYCYLPKYQNVLVLEENGCFYRVSVDGVIGYIDKDDTKELTETTIVVDLSRQILKVYKNGKEVFRCHVITGAQSMQTNLGCHTIGHHMTGFTFSDSGIYNEYWIQFDNNIGIHPADANNNHPWQKKEYFVSVADNAYNNWGKGKGKTYPNHHGSHGCVNTQIKDTEVIYSLCKVKDNVLVIEQNDLIKYKLLSNLVNKQLIKKLI